MHTITCFSYKGGAGRSTSGANLGAELARRGNRVVVVDADLNAPGLHYLFGVEHICDEPTYIGTHHLLNDMARIDQLVSSSLIDVGRHHHDGRDWSFEPPGTLLLLGSSPNHLPPLEPEDWATRMASSCLGVLRDRLEESGYDYLLIDSASGIGPVAGVCMDNSDSVLVFFRWTRQHVMGTAECLSELLQTDRRDGLGLFTVATCVPSADELEQIDDAALLKSLVVVRDEYEEMLRRVAHEALPVAEIPEFVPFKWSEFVSVFVSDGFQPLADYVESIPRRDAGLVNE